MLIPSYDVNDFSDEKSRKDIVKASIVNHVYVQLVTELLNKPVEVLEWLESCKRPLIIGPFQPTQIDQALLWLDKGAEQVVFETSDHELFNEIVVNFPLNRVILSTNNHSFSNLPHIGGIIIKSSTLTPVDETCSQNVMLQLSQACSVEEISRLHREQHRNTIVPGNEINVSEAFIKCIRTDRQDKLYPTVVTDPSGIALGLVYSNDESLATAIESGRGVYYSRSRKGLWKKGETSGNVQHLIRIDLDCDSDALRFQVSQDGVGFCHLNRTSCWGPATGLAGLEETLASRKRSAPEGSYTKRLFDDPMFLRNKLLEEAQELIEAQDFQHIAAEAADVMYFTLVRCAAAGVEIKDVEKYLNLRSLKVKRRKGDAKAERIEQAEKILSSGSSI